MSQELYPALVQRLGHRYAEQRLRLEEDYEAQILIGARILIWRWVEAVVSLQALWRAVDHEGEVPQTSSLICVICRVRPHSAISLNSWLNRITVAGGARLICGAR